MISSKSVWLDDFTPTDSITHSQGGPGSNSNKGVIAHSPEFQNWSLTTDCSLVPSPGKPALI